MPEMTCLDLLINGEPLASFGGSSLLDYSIGEVPLTVDTWQGVNRTHWNVLHSQFGLRPIKLTIVFRGRDLREAKLNRSRFNAQLFGKFEIFIPDDGFFYTCYAESLGDESLVGIGEREAKIKAQYSFNGVRHDALVTETVPAGGKLYCPSTMPFTDCKVTATIALTPSAEANESASGTQIRVVNDTVAEMKRFKVTLPPKVGGYTYVRVTNGRYPPTVTRFDFPAAAGTVYGGSADMVTGKVISTSQLLQSYDPLQMPAVLAALIEANTENASVTGETSATIPATFADYPIPNMLIRFDPYQNRTHVPDPQDPVPITGADEVSLAITSAGESSGQIYPVTFPTTFWGGTWDPITGVLTQEWAEIASYNGETLPNDEWYSSYDVNIPSLHSTPTTGAQVVYKLAEPVAYQITAITPYFYGGGSTVTPTVTAGKITQVAVGYRTGSFSDIPGVAVSFEPLESGDPVVYPADSATTYNGTGVEIPIPLGTNVFSTLDESLNIDAAWATLSSGFSLMGATFSDVHAGDVLVFDGITGQILINGVNAAERTQWVHFPSLVPGENIISGQVQTSVEFYPAYL